jgi:biotin-(acetyl-CoA carboxylase) ligase
VPLLADDAAGVITARLWERTWVRKVGGALVELMGRDRFVIGIGGGGGLQPCDDYDKGEATLEQATDRNDEAGHADRWWSRVIAAWSPVQRHGGCSGNDSHSESDERGRAGHGG